MSFRATGQVPLRGDPETPARYETVSGATRQYKLPFLLPDPYRVEAETAGFKRYVRERLQVRSNQQVALDLTWLPRS